MAVPAVPVPIHAGVQFNAELIRTLRRQGPRYTAYPTADRFSPEFRVGDYLQAVGNVCAMGARNPISLYVHIPFCESLCYYCACNKIVTRKRSKAAIYLTYLKREIEMQGRLLFRSISIDLIYGLRKQSPITMGQTLRYSKTI